MIKKLLFTGIFIATFLMPSFPQDLGIERSSSYRLESSTFVYKEPGLMEYNGTMYGLNYTYTERDHSKRSFARFEARTSSGLENYTGSTWTGTPLEIKDIPFMLWEVRGMLGVDMEAPWQFRFTPYAGLAYRYLTDNSRIQSTSGYRRESNYLYLPAGIEISRDIWPGGKIAMIYEDDLFLWGKQISHLSDADPAYDDVDSYQNQGEGHRASFMIEQQFGSFSVGLEVFERYWSVRNSYYEKVIKNSAFNGYGLEPKNYSIETGGGIVISF